MHRGANYKSKPMHETTPDSPDFFQLWPAAIHRRFMTRRPAPGGMRRIAKWRVGQAERWPMRTAVDSRRRAGVPLFPPYNLQRLAARTL